MFASLLTTLLAASIVCLAEPEETLRIESGPFPKPPAPMLMVDDAKPPPTVELSWPTREGRPTTVLAQIPFGSPASKIAIAPNIDAYIAVGGVRTDRGRGHPRGMVVRVGLYKQDAAKPFFADLADVPGGLARIRIVARGIATTLPAVERPPAGGATALVHLRYNLDDLAACGLDANARNQFLTGDPSDSLKATVTPDSALWGSLDGSRPEHGSASAARQADGSLTLTWELPYYLLRHLRDPYQRSTPGGFFEPPHFHVELEVVPIDVVEARPDSTPASAAEPK